MPRWMPVVVLLGLALAAWLLLDRTSPDPEAVPGRAAGDATDDPRSIEAQPVARGPRLAVREVEQARGVGGEAAGGPHVVRGHVEDLGGARIAGVDIAATPDDAPPSAALHATTRADGTFELSVGRRGLYRLDASAGTGSRRQEAKGWFAAGSDSHRLVLSPLPPQLVVDVVDEAGHPVPRFLVRLFPDGARAEGRAGRGSVALASASDGAGAPTPEDSPIRRVLVWNAQDEAGVGLDLGATIIAAPAIATTSNVEPSVRAVLPRVEAVSGRVLDGDGQGVAGVPVTLTAGGWNHPPEQQLLASERSEAFWNGPVSRALTDALGGFRLARATAQAPHRLAVLPPGPYVVPRKVLLEPGAVPDPVVLRLTVSARVRLLGPDGPLQGARITGGPKEEGSAWRDTPEIRAVSDPEGLVTLEHLDPEVHYHLLVEARNSPRWTGKRLAPLPVFDWKPRDSTFRLDWARPLRARVLDTTGLPVRAAEVRGFAAGLQMPFQQLTHGDGGFEWDAPPAGPLRLEVSWSEDVDSRLSLEVVVEEAEREGLVLRLPTGQVRILELEFDAPMPKGHLDRPRPAVLIWNKAGWERTTRCRTDWMPLVPGEERLPRLRLLGLPADARVRVVLVLPQLGFVDTELLSGDVTRRRLEPGQTLRLRMPEGAAPDKTWWVSLDSDATLDSDETGAGAYAMPVEAVGRLLSVGGVPPGRWHVRIEGVESDDWRIYRVTASPGAVTDVPLPPDPIDVDGGGGR